MAELLYLHGLESGPAGRKARWLAAHYDTIVPQLDNAAAIAAIDRRTKAGWVDGDPSVREALGPALTIARAAIEAHRPEIVVGSSFGGALAAALLADGTWSGPTLLLAPAATRLLGDVRLPPTTRAVVVHGRHDDVVPVDHGRALAATGGPDTLFVEVDDGHRLEGILEAGVLEAMIGWLFRGA